MKYIWIVLTIFTVVYLFYRIKMFDTIDSCLDKGGAWNYPEKRCILRSPSPE